MDDAIELGLRTPDIARPGEKTSTTSAVGDAIAAAVALTCVALLGSTPAQAQAPQAPAARPNILVIFGDDVGQSNLSA